MPKFSIVNTKRAFKIFKFQDGNKVKIVTLY